MHTLKWQNKIFYFFLLAMMVLHGSFMAVQLKDKISFPEMTTSEVIKLKLIQETFSSKRQMVQSEDAATDEKPTDKAFLSDKDRKFERETMAKNIDSFKKAALGNSAITQVAQKSSQQKKKPNLKDLKLSDVGVEVGDMNPAEVQRTPASASLKGMENGDPTSQGLSATNDYVEEVNLGDFTRLNTIEYKHYGFFHRIRQKLEQFWGRSIQEKSDALFRAGRRLPASENLITSLRITLNTKGEIVGVKILGTSGVKELDDAAIESFNQAGPFPNPPQELLVNGKATIEWGFVVKS